MSIFLNADSRLVVQGMTGSEGTKHTRRMVASGAQVVAGVTPAKPAKRWTVSRCSTPWETPWPPPAPTSLSSSCRPDSPRSRGRSCRCRHAAGGRHHRGVPVADTAWFFQYAQNSGTTRIIGLTAPASSRRGRANAGDHPGGHHRQGRPIGLVSKSGTLTYQMMYELRDIGFSTAVGIGGDPIIGTTHIDCLAA